MPPFSINSRFRGQLHHPSESRSITTLLPLSSRNRSRSTRGCCGCKLLLPTWAVCSWISLICHIQQGWGALLNHRITLTTCLKTSVCNLVPARSIFEFEWYGQLWVIQNSFKQQSILELLGSLSIMPLCIPTYLPCAGSSPDTVQVLVLN